MPLPEGRGMKRQPTARSYALGLYDSRGLMQGIVMTQIGDYSQATAMTVLPNGKLVVAGGASGADGNLEFALAEYNASGALNTSFGTGGIVTTKIGDQ